MKKVERYYDKSAQAEWQRLQRHRTEFAVTMRVMDEYLPEPPCSVLDVGGGPGRYAIALAEKGYDVMLVELSGRSLEFAEAKAKEAGVTLTGFIHADATNLGRIKDESYDAVLLMGPLYHLIKRAKREKALFEARRVLKKEGCLFASFITRYAPIRMEAKVDPDWVFAKRRRFEKLFSTGVHEPRGKNGRFTDAYFAMPSEIKPFIEKRGFQTLDLVSCEGIVALIEEKVNELTGDLWEAWVNLNCRLGKDPSIHGAAEHLLYVGRKI
jgi:S-adenosylmethionine-dependent methyltransferase